MELKGTEFTIDSKTQKSYLRPRLSQKDIQGKTMSAVFQLFPLLPTFEVIC